MNQYPQQQQGNSSARTIYTVFVVIFFLIAIVLLGFAIAVVVEGYISIGLFVASAIWFIIATSTAIHRFRLGKAKQSGSASGLQQQQTYMTDQQYSMPQYSTQNQNHTSAPKPFPQTHTYPVHSPSASQVPMEHQPQYPQQNMGYQDTRVFEQTLR